jgi:hypothetical protein
VDTRNQILENGINQLYESFTRFSNQISKVIASDADLATLASFRDTLEIFTAVANEIGTHDGEEEKNIPTESTLISAASVLPPTITNSPNEGQRTWRGAEESRGSSLNMSAKAHTSQQPTFTSLEPSIFLMPVNNPVMTNDYWNPNKLRVAKLPLWQRLFIHSMVDSQTHLSAVWDARASQSSWLLRAHKYSLRCSTPLALMHLTAIGLRVAAMEYEEQAARSPAFGPTPASKHSSKVDSYFDVERYHLLGTKVREEMTSDGVRSSDIINAEEVEGYLTGKGMTGYNDREIYIKLSPESLSDGQYNVLGHDSMLCVVEMESFIQAMVDVAFCLGDAIGYPQEAINWAILRSCNRLVPMGL